MWWPSANDIPWYAFGSMLLLMILHGAVMCAAIVALGDLHDRDNAARWWRAFFTNQ